MKTKKLKYLIVFAVGVLLVVMVYQSLSQPGVQDLKGNYSELDVFRNENNTGPVVRIFAVYTDKTLWEDMRDYGDFMPHNKYGNTKVFFFDQPVDGIQLSPEAPHFQAAFQRFCIGRYEKTAMGETNFTKYPFSEP